MEKDEKIPIDRYGEGNCCPECGSTRISINLQYPLEVTRDLKTGKERITDRTGKLISKPSNKMLAHLYKNAQFVADMWTYECRKCGWMSDTMVP